MKKSIIIILIAAAAMLCSCADPVIIVTDVTINPEKCTLAIGEKDTITAIVSPSDATNAKVIWTSSNSSVATIDNGFVTAIAPGTATITAKTDDGGFTSKCEVTVLENIIHVESVKLLGADGKDLTDFNLRKGDSTLLAAAISPADATDQSIVWTSSDSTVFTVENGLVKAVGAGKATLTAYTVDRAQTQQIVISISNPATSITLAPSSISMYEYGIEKITVDVKPGDNDSKLIWTSSNEDLVTVNQLGIITARQVNGKDNTAIIKVASADDPEVYAECTVSVTCKVIGVAFDSKDLYVKEGCTTQAKAIVYPPRSDNKDIEWISGNTSVASVDADGLITGHKAGIATITVRTKDGGKEAVCTVHVISKVADISVTPDQQDIPCGGSISLKATINPGNATFPGVKWSSSNPKVAAVDSLGKVEALSVGHATIIASSCDGGFTAFCKIHVTSALTSITLHSKLIDIYQGATAEVGYSYAPSNATDVNIKWISSDTTVVQVINGTAIAINPGSATVSAVCGLIEDKCQINVYARVAGIELNKKALDLLKGSSEKLTATLSPKGISKEDSSIEWISADESIATVDMNGNVTAVRSGETVITVYSKDRKFSSRCTVTVTNPIKSFTVTPGSSTLYETETVQLNCGNVTPSDADKGTYIWESSDKSVASVSSTGLVTALKAGKATITAKVSGNEGVKSTSVIEVKCHVSGISVSKSSLELIKGQIETGIKVTISPDRANEKGFTAVSANSEVAVVTKKQDGTLTIEAKAAGTTVITVRSDDQGKEATINVNVKEITVNKVSLNKTTLTLIEGNNETLTATVDPSDAFDKSLSWVSSDPSVATVTEGKVVALKPGNVTITVTSLSNSLAKAECVVTVKPRTIPVESLTPSSKSITLVEKTSGKISVTVLPGTATDKSLSWTSNNTSVATVDASGNINAITPGTATITVTAKDGSNVSCIITVIVTSSTPVKDSVHVKKLNIIDKIDTIYVGETVSVHAIITPANADDKKVTWNVSTSSVDILSAKCGKTTSNAVEGILRGIKAGSARVTIESNDMYNGIRRSVTITVVVIPREIGITLSCAALTMKPGEHYKLNATVKPLSSAAKGITWTSSDSSVVQVDKDGNLTAIKAGNVTIKAKTVDGGKEATCSVKVSSQGTGAGNIEPIRFTDI